MREICADDVLRSLVLLLLSMKHGAWEDSKEGMVARTGGKLPVGVTELRQETTLVRCNRNH